MIAKSSKLAGELAPTNMIAMTEQHARQLALQVIIKIAEAVPATKALLQSGRIEDKARDIVRTALNGNPRELAPLVNALSDRRH